MNYLFNNKILDAIAIAIRPTTRQLTFEGTIRSSKTVTAIEAFFWRVYYSDGTRHLVASYDSDTLKNNILEADGHGLLTKFSAYCREKKDRIGGWYIEVGTPTGKKQISLCSYSNKSKWKKVLGGSIENIFIDEANVADPQFINECYSRQVSFEHPLTVYTLNGDVPTAFIYEHINPSKIIGHAPASIYAEMDHVPKKKGYYYLHWTMADNPIMTLDKIAAAAELYPIGSYYHKIKILGERGTPGKLIYVDYMDEEKLLQEVDVSKYHSFTISMDVGATRAKNSISLVGYTYGYTKAALITKKTFPCVGYNEKTAKLKAFILYCQGIGARNIENVIIDNAE